MRRPFRSARILLACGFIGFLGALAHGAGSETHGIIVANIDRSVKPGDDFYRYANGEWIKRKNNVVNRFGHSSYYMGVSLQNIGQTIEEKYLIPSGDYAAHGGAFPLIIKDVGVVGTITVSGLPQQEDHELVVTTLRQFLASSIE